MASRIVGRLLSGVPRTCRHFCASARSESNGEKQISEVLQNEFKPTQLEVTDISGGCGSMYNIDITSELFRGKRQVEQHKMVNKALSQQIKAMHGLRISTAIPDS